MRFEQAYVNTPLCCPARASLLSGGFLAKETGVRQNTEPNGSIHRFLDADTLPVRLQEAGYTTGLIGKYLNEYDDVAPYVPPGWDTFVVPLLHEDWSTYEVIRGASTADAAGEGEISEVQRYFTDFAHAESEAFLAGLASDEPFFLMVTHYAPHYPATPAEAYDGAFKGEIWRGGAFDEEDVSDKPSYLANSAPIEEGLKERNDNFYQDALESLLSVDDSVAALLAQLEAAGRLDETIVIFASDNGYMWGEHRLYTKGFPYQESIHVPLLARVPWGQAGEVTALTSVTTDVPATIYDLAGIDAPTGGESLAPFLRGEEVEGWRESLFIEGYGLTQAPDYAGFVTEDWKYVEYASGEVELYDLQADPYEEESLHLDPAQEKRIAEFSAELAPLKGLMITSDDILFTVGEPEQFTLTAEGGTPPYTWAVAKGELPPGVEMSAEGVLEGKIDARGGAQLMFQVTDSGASPWTGAPQVYYTSLWVEAAAAGEAIAPPRAAGAPRIRAVEGAAEIALPLSRPFASRLYVAADPHMDNNPRSVDFDATDGVMRARLSGLTPGTTWYAWVEELEGGRFTFQVPEE